MKLGCHSRPRPPYFGGPSCCPLLADTVERSECEVLVDLFPGLRIYCGISQQIAIDHSAIYPACDYVRPMTKRRPWQSRRLSHRPIGSRSSGLSWRALSHSQKFMPTSTVNGIVRLFIDISRH